MVALDKLNLSRVDRGWIAFEAHLVTTEEVIRGFGPMSHRIQGILNVLALSSFGNTPLSLASNSIARTSVNGFSILQIV